MKYSQKTYEHAPASLAEKADRDVSDPMPLTRDPLRRMVCRNCGECQTVWGWAANSLFMRVFRWFWNGKIHLDKSEICGYSETSRAGTILM